MRDKGLCHKFVPEAFVEEQCCLGSFFKFNVTLKFQNVAILPYTIKKLTLTVKKMMLTVNFLIVKGNIATF